MGITVCFRMERLLIQLLEYMMIKELYNIIQVLIVKVSCRLILNIMLAMNIWSANRLEIVLSLISLRNWI